MTAIAAAPRREHRYAPVGSARELFECRADEVALSGAAGTGKTRAALEKVHMMCLLNPGMRALVCRKTAVSLTSTTLVTFREHVAKEALESGEVKWYGGSQQEAASYHYGNGSTITVGGLDKATRIMSSEYDVCFTGDTEVFSASPVECGFDRPYSGQLVTITTAAGNKLTGTPNHPILTPHGWVGLGSLRKGDYVISRVPGQPLPAHPNPGIANQPSPIAEVVRALAEAGGGSGVTKRIEAVPMNFHGDRADSYVDVVTTLGHLQDGRLAALLDPVAELDRRRAELEQAALMGQGTGIKRAVRLGSALLSAPAAAELAHPFPVGLGLAPRLGGALPSFGKLALPLGIDSHLGLEGGHGVGVRAPLNPACSHLPLEARDADVNGLSYLHQPPFSGEVTADRVVDVSVADAGQGRHVYNLQTEASWYYASNIIVHNCYVGEATELTEDDWEAITTRLRNGKVSFQQLMADCNPDAPHHWLKQRADRGAVELIYCRHEDNPRLYDAQTGRWTPEGETYISRLDALTGVRKERLRYGRWAAAEGLVYDMFDPTIHLSTRFNRDSHPPQDWPRYLAIDFGFTNPFAALWLTEDPDGRLYVYRELYRTRGLVEDHAREIRKLHRTKHGPEPEFRAIICDHDAEDRATFERHYGRGTVAAHKDVLPGIEAVKARLKVQPDGKPRLFLCRDALASRDPALADAKKPVCLNEEILEYVWDTRPQPGGDMPREAPAKRGDHALDALRYACAELDLKDRPSVRFIRR